MPPEPILSVRRLARCYGSVAALGGVDLDIAPGSTLALVGESGSGKSTLARMVVRLENPDSGEIRFEGHDILALRRADLLEFRRRAQMVFQDAAGALNPRFTAAQIVAEPLAVHGLGSKTERRRRALELMERTGLAPGWADRAAHEFSGGERRRLALARALALEPRFLVLDETLSGLDPSVQAHIANLLLDLQRTHALTYLLISHDLTLAACLADRIAVMHAGRVVETASPQELLASPRHARSRALVEAMPVLPCAT